ncbi:MAG: hypothetical protein A3D96_02610 [Chlamydiae bacterium RIFCSPHIGHO2_12_FULL_44_59]|nr:MAG: hypothetical protein A2796_05335 [Chlamydiae bacterium RIFCSPHIGHO2_01_FULL_44_39]OGN57071.1 MAG: hypothetical protein A3C42_05990 [Chlamydiae bacterium RIFCSPHIGHO2_02_FULL_45_9]OGN60006.1 MAG: hypothetical protein A3D96_02610 [Chlamydiae bacterium RIFCSPHIGHO2_12_FULL_44_59]OGN65933.1 MAG: hypothetical protein A2978_06425 [Chlamydiae bacterium RIFCSPLOWO2_01_FULL_44_52]OGN68193.1 MAG: hypothetical protein A3I67_07260 [Chlamydiae bacterium RIFCSPLOWO2_02_FULL_45_22]OGN70027.1 MAG: hyp
MRAIILTLMALTIFSGGYWTWNHQPKIRTQLEDLMSSSTFQTLEVRYSAESIMDAHRRELLQDSDHVFLEPALKFVPYLLMEVKYIRTHDKTGEGVILWGLVDGEMVINTGSWEKTHGFTDCIASNATRQEFKIINALAARGGSWDRDGLSRFLNIENNVLDTWVDSCRKKSLIVQSGNIYRLHLQNPKLQVIPETKLDQWLVTKPTKHAKKVKKRYRSGQIEHIATAAFGPDFAIRKTTEIFLPVYSIIVQNPDGSQMTTYWNALNGKRLLSPPNEIE